jgi:hypothetical protein
MPLSAGAISPAPERLQDALAVHAVTNDGQACCSDLVIDLIRGATWSEVPYEHRCVACQAVVGDFPTR